MLEGVTVSRNAGQALPESLVTHLLGQGFDRYLGIAYADGDEVRITRLAKTDKWKPGWETIHGADDRLKDRRVIYHFGKCNDELLNNSELQPYAVLTNDQNKHQIVAFLDGNFSQFTNTGSVRFDQSLCAEKYIAPKIGSIAKFVNFDLAKIMEFLEDQTTAQDMINTMVSERGNIVLLDAGDADVKYTVEGDETEQSFDWGWISNVSGWSEGVKAVEAAEAEEDPLLAAVVPVKDKRIAATAPAVVPAAPPAAPPSKVPPAAQPVPTSPAPEQLIIAIPNGVMGDDRKKTKWMRKRTTSGVLPSNWKEASHMVIDAATANALARQTWSEQQQQKNGPVKSFQEMGAALGAAVPKTDTAIPPAAATPPASKRVATPTETLPEHKEEEPKKETAPAHVGKPAEEQPQVVTGRTGIASPASLAHFKEYMESDHFKDALGKHNEEMKDPIKFWKNEETNASFIKQLGHPQYKELSDTFIWDPEVRFQLCKNEPNLAEIYMRSMILEIYKLTKMLDKLTEPAAKPEQQPAPAAAPPMPRQSGFPKSKRIA